MSECRSLNTIDKEPDTVQCCTCQLSNRKNAPKKCALECYEGFNILVVFWLFFLGVIQQFRIMTYCLAMKIDEGLVFCSDSRTNAGPDRVNSYSKMHRFSVSGDRSLVILSAGNLATSQAVVSRVKRDMKDDTGFHFGNAEHLADVADYIGKISLEEQNKFTGDSGPNGGYESSASFIIGGQIKNNTTKLYMIYPEGNHIACSKQHPFLQIGETKYGKPILDRIIRNETPREVAMRCALVSTDSTMRSNATVGPPIELLFYPVDSLGQEPMYYRYDGDDPYFVSLRASWDDKIRESFNELPPLESPST